MVAIIGEASIVHLSDKDLRRPDAYHSCYVLAGLSSAQHVSMFERCAEIDVQSPLDAAFGWVLKGRAGTHQADVGETLYDLDDTLASLHPIFVIPWAAVKETKTFFAEKMGF